jgi:hypothetical protein
LEEEDTGGEVSSEDFSVVLDVLIEEERSVGRGEEEVGLMKDGEAVLDEEGEVGRETVCEEGTVSDDCNEVVESEWAGHGGEEVERGGGREERCRWCNEGSD